ncbi:hypothetical protein P5673_026969 [Acropora cervicornis]|uniref:Transposase Helix-turn-helix domain-containing protein n=1 Tax=Acropora cervicornis TaxID=6130 RepID=A0AAD9UW77_ACRCE|nr:hypothetical protein P5673_026969 [Acropora cervicornis]
MSENVNKDSFICKPQDRLDEVLSDKEKLEEKVSQISKFENADGLPGANGESIRYSSSLRDYIHEGHGDHSAKQGLSRQGFAEIHLAQLFNVSQSTVSRILISWINFMHLKLGQINIWSSRELVDESMPQDFKDKYPSARVKNCKIFDGGVPLNLFGLFNQMWCVCAMLCNMQDPIINTANRDLQDKC